MATQEENMENPSDDVWRQRLFDGEREKGLRVSESLAPGVCRSIDCRLSPIRATNSDIFVRKENQRSCFDVKPPPPRKRFAQILRHCRRPPFAH